MSTKDQSEGRRKNGAVPPWEITKGAGEKMAEKAAKPPPTSDRPSPR